MKILNIMNSIQSIEVNNISECNLLHDIINPFKHTENTNSPYSPILHVFMNTCKVKAKFNNFLNSIG